MNPDAFQRAYKALNSAQKRAVDTIEGPVMVIAGPGTGKTQILALRIANILAKSDVPASAILALTYTESGVVSMRKRLESLIGSRAYEVRIHTFHGFANQVIKRYPERFPRIIGCEQILELDAYSIIETILDSGTFPTLRPINYPYLNVKDIKGAISEAKRENIRPAALAERILKEITALQSVDDFVHTKGAHKGKVKGVYADALKRLEKARELAVLYGEYERILTETHRFDFEDTILEVVHALEADQELRLILQEEHQYILADEHQDANGAQNRILELLAEFHDSPNLFIVGDEKQAIFRFQGASLENFLFFKRRYPEAELIELESNYRSTQVILDAAHDVVAPTRGEDSVPRPRLRADAGHAHCAVSVRISPDLDTEVGDLVDAVRTHIEAGVAGGEIAILLRRNSDVRKIAQVLRQGGIRASASADMEALGTPAVQGLIALLRAAAFFGRDAELYPLLYAPWAQLSNLDIFRLTEKGAGSLFETLGSPATLKELSLEDPKQAHALFSVVDDVATAGKDHGIHDTALIALQKSGIMERITAHDDLEVALESLRAFLSFVEETEQAHPAYTIRDLIHVLDRAVEYGISLVPPLPERADAVRVMTVHRAKGMEFDHVVIPQCVDARWGGTRARRGITLPLYHGGVLAHDEDDERRLFYVAMTRARKSLTLSYAIRGEGVREQLPSRFIGDISPTHIEVVSVPARAPLFATFVPPVSLREELQTYVRARLASQGLSVSALNNYLDSPWKYFFLSLLRMPSRKEPYLHFGTAVDGALRLYTRASQEETVSIERVIEEFNRIFARLPLTPTDRKTYGAKGEAILRGYLGAHRDTPQIRAEAGVSVSVPFETGIPEIPQITLKGEFDRVEYLDDTHIRVIDWKTGAPKSRGEIEGTTKNSEGHYKRQLMFYTLIAPLDPVRPRTVSEARIDFIQPDPSGNYRQEAFVISEREIESLKETIRTVVGDISTLAFLERECDPTLWSEEGCALVASLKARL